MDNLLTEIIRSIFDEDDVSQTELPQLIEAIKKTGIKKKSHLRWLKEEDIKDVLPAVQVRMLLDGFQRRGLHSTPVLNVGPQNSHQSEIDVSSVSTTPRSLVSSSPVSVVSMPVSAERGQTWVEGFAIPWLKCSTTFLATIDEGKPPLESELRELVGHTVSDIFVNTRRASRNTLKQVAKKIVQRNPNAFADYMNGKQIGDGVTSIMLKLESKKENLNRRNVKASQPSPSTSGLEVSSASPANLPSAVLIAVTPKRSTAMPRLTETMSYGCIEFEPYIPDLTSVDLMESQRIELRQLYADDSLSARVTTLMNMKYPLQRQIINKGIPIAQILDQWPYLGSWRYTLQHFQKLTGLEPQASVTSGVFTKGPKTCEFFESGKAFTNNPALVKLLSETHNRHNSFLLMIMAYFRERADTVVQFLEVAEIEDVDTMSLPPSPVVIGLGANVHTCQRYVVAVNRSVFPVEIPDFLTAISVLFATYYVFNMEYEPECVATLEYIQRDLVNMNPESGAKSSKGRKRGVNVCPRLVTFFRKASQFEAKRVAPSSSTFFQANTSHATGPLVTSFSQSTSTPQSAVALTEPVLASFSQSTSTPQSAVALTEPVSASFSQSTLTTQSTVALTEPVLAINNAVAASSMAQFAGTRSKRARKRQHVENDEAADTDRTPCLVCSILYCESDCDWFPCKVCKNWACAICAKVTRNSKKRLFICNNCQ